MFTLEGLQAMRRHEVLDLQRQLKVAWRDTYHLKGMMLIYGKQTAKVLAACQVTTELAAMRDALESITIKGRSSLLRVEKRLESIDNDLRLCDIRLADGSKWYTAQEIVDMGDEVMGYQHSDTP